jgi:hypothetical protein
MIKLFAIIMVIFLFLPCFAGNTHDSIPDEKYVEFGEKFECVVWLQILEKNDSRAFASGVVIDKNWILTAAHAICNSKKVSCKIDDNIYESVDIVYPKEFNLDNVGYYDIALIKVDKDINLDFYPKFYTLEDHINKMAAISGYGIVSKASKIEYEFDNKRRAGSNVIESYDKHMLICLMSKNDHSPLEFILTSGDSGGGLFIDGKLAGINSCLIAEDGELDGSYGDLSGHTRIDLFEDWIEETKK